jgi:hypothetical protein
MYNKRIITVDVGNMSPKEVDEYMENVIRKLKGFDLVVKEEKTKWQRFKTWLYNIFDTLGLAGSFGGFNI